VHGITRWVLSLLALVGLAAPVSAASSFGCSGEDRGALLVGAIALGVRKHAGLPSEAGSADTGSARLSPANDDGASLTRNARIPVGA
jgi:hypothetical protein